MNKKFIISLIAVLAISVAILVKQSHIFFKKETTDVKPTVKIGATLPLSGDGAEAGQSAKAAMEMVLEEFQAKGLKYNYELIFEDNQMNPQKVATTTNKLINIDKVDAVFSIWNIMSNVASSIAEQNSKLSFSCSLGKNAAKGPYSYNTVSSFEDQAEALIKELKKRKIKTVAFFTDNTGYVEPSDVVINKINSTQDLKVIFLERFSPYVRDYRMAIAKADKLKPDMYVIQSLPPSPYIFIKQLGEITGNNHNVTSIDVIGEINDNNRNIANGLWYIDSNHMGNKEFQDNLLKNKGISAQSCSGNIAAGMEILINAYENVDVKAKNDIPTNDAIRKWISKNVINFKTYAGNINVDSDGIFATKPTVKIIKDGKIVDIED